MMIEDHYEDLLCSLFDISVEQREEADFDIEDVCFDKFDISFGDFVRVVSQLLPLANIVESPLSRTLYHAFTHNGIAFVKMKVAEDYDAT